MRLLACLLALAPVSAAQTTWFVNAAGTAPGTGTLLDPFVSLQFAIDQPTTVDGDTIQVAAGTYAEAIDFLGKSILVDGSAAVPLPTIDGGGSGSTVSFQSGEGPQSILRGFLVTGGIGRPVGNDLYGGGVWISGAAPRLEGVRITGNSANLGGGLALEGGSATLLACEILDNEAEIGGGIHVSQGSISMSGGFLRQNRALSFFIQAWGGGVAMRAAATGDFTDVLFEDNSAFPNGGGGGLYTTAGSGLVQVTDSVFRGNTPGTFNGPGIGGGILALGELVGSGLLLENNGGIGAGADGVFWGGGASGGDYTDCVFRENRAQLGGGLEGGSATNCQFFANVGCADGSGRGGAARFSQLTDCLLQDNWACGSGGGADICDLTNCQVLYNRALPEDAGAGTGGGLSGGSAQDCRLHGNEVRGLGASDPGSGGGAFLADLERCVVTSNSADQGGGTWGGSTDRVSLVGNVADAGSGLFAGTHSNALVWHNLTTSVAGFPTMRYSNVEGGVPGTGNIDAPPLLFDTSGSDVHLQAGSPCIDAGDPASPRDPDGSLADMGALPLDPLWVAEAGSYCRPGRILGLANCLPLIQVVGEASFSNPDPVVCQGVNIPSGQFGLLFHGGAPTSIPFASFMTNGTLCIAPPLVRLTPISSGAGAPCEGTLTQAITDAELSALGLVPGDRLYTQFWFRQPISGFSALTDAASIPILP